MAVMAFMVFMSVMAFVVFMASVANLVRTEGKHNEMISRNISSSSNHNKKPKLKHFELREQRNAKTKFSNRKCHENVPLGT